MINITVTHLNKILNCLSIPSIDCCLKSSSSSLSIESKENNSLTCNNVDQIGNAVENESENKDLINNDVITLANHEESNTIDDREDRIEFKETLVLPENTIQTNFDNVEEEEEDDININKLFPTFLKNLKKQQQEIEISDKLNIDDKVVDDPLKIYSNEIMLKKLEKIDDKKSGGSTKKSNHDHLIMNDRLTITDYLHERLFLDMMSKSKNKRKNSKTNSHKKNKNLNFHGNIDDDINDKFESTLLYRYGLASRFFEKKPKTKKSSKKG